MEQALNRADEVADTVLRSTKSFLRPLARLCLLSTFAEDGLRMIFQWSDQSVYVKHTWNCGAFLASLFVFVNLVFQLVPVGLVLAQKFVRPAVACLVGIVFLQTIAYSVLWNWNFFLRNLAVLGGLVLLIAETTESPSDTNFFAGLPSLDERNQTGDILQLSGRILVVLMFGTLMHFDSSVRIIFEIICSLLLVCVTVGFKTKPAALLLVVTLMLLNLTFNHFWTKPFHSPTYDFMKYDFFQTMSVVGGLLMVVALGPGGLSADAAKKRE